MASEPTSALTFDDLTLAVAEKLGTASYGTDGTSAAAIPTNAQDLAQCRKIVNDAIRMFLSDAPNNGWRWTRPVASVDLWPDVAVSTANKIATATLSGGVTTVTVPTDSFYPSMELRDVVITGVGTFNVSQYVSTKSVKLTGDATAAVNKTWSVTTTGDYTLPIGFGGVYLPGLTFAAGTNLGVNPQWVDESDIRQWRSNVTQATGIPHLFSVRPMATGTPRRRWEMSAYPKPSQYVGVQFPYVLHFDKLIAGTETHPAPFTMDEAVKAACLAQAEKDVDKAFGTDWNYYKGFALPGAYRADAMSAPKTLGYFWNPAGSLGSIRDFRQNMQRPTVRVNL